MLGSSLVRWPDVVVIVLNLAVMVAVGIYCSRKNRSADSYFFAGRRMPGWVVSFSIMATIVSSMTFLATPGATFKENWKFMPAHFLYFVPVIVAYFIFMPFFRRAGLDSAYEYLERRFGTWARMYGALAFLMHHFFRMGIILYVVSLAFQKMIGLELGLVIVILGVLVAVYTIAGGLEAVIYTDLIQGVTLIVGGLIVTPIIIHELPGGWHQLFTEAAADNKWSVGSTSFAWGDLWNDETVWIIVLTYQFMFLQLICTDQSMVQRFLSIRSDREARRGLLLSTALTIPVWLYFAFVGTALYVLYKTFPDPAVVTLLERGEPEAIFPHFILTKVPAGVAGFVLAGMAAAAMSTLDSSINSSAATATNDFYRRIRPSHPDQRHYLVVGRLFSVLFSAVMILVALVIYLSRTETLMDVQTVIYPIVSTGIVSLFLLGFFTTRVGNRAAATATVVTLVGVAAWTLLMTDTGKERFPDLAEYLPHKYWIGVLPYVFLMVLSYLLSIFLPRRPRGDLGGLTVWTRGRST